MNKKYLSPKTKVVELESSELLIVISNGEDEDAGSKIRGTRRTKVFIDEEGDLF